MSQRARILLVVAIIVVIVIALAMSELLSDKPEVSNEQPEEGRIHIYLDGQFKANVDPEKVTTLPMGSFKDSEENKTQEGPWLKDLILLYVDERDLRTNSSLTLSGVRPSSGSAKQATVTWEQVIDENNHLILDISGSGDSLKLVSTMPELDVRDEWVQGVSRIDIVLKP